MDRNELKTKLELTEMRLLPEVLTLVTAGWKDEQYHKMIALLGAAGFRNVKPERIEKQEVIAITGGKTYGAGNRIALEFASVMSGPTLVEVNGEDMFYALQELYNPYGNPNFNTNNNPYFVTDKVEEATQEGLDIIDCATSGDIELCGELDGHDVQVRLCMACVQRAIMGSEKELNMFRDDKSLRMLLAAVMVMAHEEGVRVETAR